MFRTALRNVLAHKARLLMTMLAVLLGTAFVAGTLVLSETISEAYLKSSQQSLEHVDVQIRPTDGRNSTGTGRLPDGQLRDAAAALPGAASATGVVSGFAALAGKDGQLVGAGWSTLGTNHPGPDNPRYPITAGRPPRAEGDIAIDARTAERTGYQVGDTVRMSVSGPVTEKRITGIFATDDGNVAAGGTLTLVDTATAQKLFAKAGHYNQIDLTAKPGTSPEQLRAEVERILPAGAEAVTGTQLAAEQADRNAQTASLFATVLLACAGIALFVGIFLIANTFTMLVAQRTKELALLRAVGATRRQVTRSVLLEALLAGLVAAAAGLAAGIGVGAGLRAVLPATGAKLPDGPLVVGAVPVLIALAVGVGVTLLAAWLPARRAAKIPPVAAMSSVHAPAAARSLRVRNAIGAVLAAGGGLLVITATTMNDGRITLGAGFALLLIGVFVLTPLLSRPVIAAATPVLRRFGICGRLAGQNALRNPRRTAATASALMIGLTLITGLTVIGTSAARSIDKLFVDSLRADFIISMAGDAGPLAPDTVQTLSKLDEVTAISPGRMAQVRVDGEDQVLTGFNSESVRELFALEFTEGSFAPGDTAVVDDKTAAARGWHRGDALDVAWSDGTSGKLEISGIYRSEAIAGIKADVSVVDPHLDRIADTEVTVKTTGGDSEAMRRILERALGDNPAIRVHDKQTASDEAASAINLILNLLYGMLAMAVLIAVLGVINTLAMSVHERTQEIGLLRAIGLDRSGVRLMIRLESLAISLFGGILGVGLGVLFGWAVGELIAASGASTWTLVLPWGRMALWVAMAALVGVVAALGPARRAARLNTLEAINAE